VLALAGRVVSELRVAACPALEALAGEFGETAVLSVPDADDAVVVEQVLGGEHMVIVHYRPGFRHELSRGAHGRALLAFADPALVRRLLARCGEQTARRVEETRARGYAISHDELLLGVSGLAAPVRDGGGTVVASIGVVAPVHRFPDPERLATSVLGEAEAITTRLGAAHGRSRPRQGRGQQGGDDGVLPQGG
jgi:DNA-binding IclR family transcriptional regulator